MPKPILRAAWLTLAMLAPAVASAQAAPPSSGFRSLWTGWRDANARSLQIERNSVERVREEVAAADAARLAQLRNRGRALGERVGEIVRLGDCDEGERVAREAGDFALVEAVREHCGRTEEPPR